MESKSEIFKMDIKDSMSTIEKVVDGGFCIGCGGCAVATRGAIKMVRDRFSVPIPILTNVSVEALTIASKVCPFSSESPNEDVISSRLYGKHGSRDPKIGSYLSLMAGRVSDDKVVMSSSSGGLTTWLLLRLLKSNLIDGVVHLGAGSSDPSELFSFQVSHTSDEILEKRKSQYYSADFSSAVLSIRGNGKRYAFVGVPCYAKALRNIGENDPVLRGQMIFVISLVCGHMKSPAFAELLSWQLGISPGDLTGVDFRVKEGTTRADDYNFSAKSGVAVKPVVARTRDLYGSNWGHAMLQLQACDFCDDVFGETADICLGDAWLDRYTDDFRGTNVLVIRNPVLEQIVLAGIRSGEVAAVNIDLDSVVSSQGGNFRHRREGLAVRLFDNFRRGQWCPEKRKFIDFRSVSYYRRLVVRLRRRLGVVSHFAFLEAKAAGDLQIYFARTKLLVSVIGFVYRLPIIFSPSTLYSRIVGRINRLWA